MTIPLAIGLIGADGRDMSLALEGGRPVVRGVLTLTQAAQTFTFAGVTSGRCCRSIAASRRRSRSRRTFRPTNSGSSPRTTPIRSIAGRRCSRSRNALLADNVAAIGAGRAPREDAGLIAALAAVLADRIARAGLRGADAHAAGRGRHRARHRPRRRSRRHLCGALRAARRASGHGSGRRCARPIGGWRTTGPTAPTPRARDAAR